MKTSLNGDSLQFYIYWFKGNKYSLKLLKNLLITDVTSSSIKRTVPVLCTITESHFTDPNVLVSNVPNVPKRFPSTKSCEVIRSQFHQHFISSFCVWKSYAHIFYPYRLSSYILAEKNLAKKLFVKCCWNWLQALKHLGQKPFSCHICGKGFVQKQSLSAHLGSTHDLGTAAESCKFCSKPFFDQSYLKKHFRWHLKIQESKQKQ